MPVPGAGMPDKNSAVPHPSPDTAVDPPASPRDVGVHMPDDLQPEPGGRRSSSLSQSETFQMISRLSLRVSTRSRSASSIGKPQATLEGSRRSCWCCTRRYKAPPFQQTLVVLRHSERRDYVDPDYRTSPEGQAWPHDAPLTEAGVKLAKDVAEELAKLHEKAGFAAVASSPYRRCLQTAAEVANLLDLPVVLDQEIGEVRDETMPKEAAHRSPVELAELCRSLGLGLLNPTGDERGVKLFGREPPWPETLEEAKQRYIVRIETYINQSAEMQSNMILVTHADAVAASLVMFERGGCDIQKMGFCARVIAQRNMNPQKKEDEEHGVYAEHWDVEFRGLDAEIFHDDAMAKYNERMYLETCVETQQRFVQRKDKRTKTDMCFESTLKELKEKEERDKKSTLSKLSEKSEDSRRPSG